MTNEKIFEALGNINERYVIEARESGVSVKMSSLKINKAALVAAILAILLCGTAAAAGIMWLTPKVEIDENQKDYSFALMESNYELPEEVLNKIAERIPNPGIGFEFDSIDEWQVFYELPFVAGDITIPRDHKIVSYITSGTSEESFIPGQIESTMYVSFALSRYDRESAPWYAIMKVYTVTKDGSFGKIENTEKGLIINEVHHYEPTTDILVESTTDFGMPYTIVVSKAGPEEDHEHYEHTLYKFKLIYGYESSLYHLELYAFGEDEYEKALARLTDYVNTIEIRYPAE